MRAPYDIKYLNGLTGLGYVGYGKRQINHSTMFDGYWDLSTLKGTDPILTKKGQQIGVNRATDKTIEHKQAIVKSTLHQTRKIANRLQGATPRQTLENIYNYFVQFYQYKPDDETAEELRSPARAYQDRITGIDCDCFAISISSILTNLGILHAIRRAQYDASVDFTHVYVVVPKTPRANLDKRSDYYVIDPVVLQFDYEWPSNQTPAIKSDTFSVQNMNGLGRVIADLINVPNVIDPVRQVITRTTTTSTKSTSLSDRPDRSILTVEPSPAVDILDRIKTITDRAAEKIANKPVITSTTTVQNTSTPTPPPVDNSGIAGKIKDLASNPVRAGIMVGALALLGTMMYQASNSEAPKKKTTKTKSLNGPSTKRKTGRSSSSRKKSGSKKTIKVKI